MVLSYKAGLKSGEEGIEFFKTNESIYSKDIKKLKFEIHYNEITIRELRKKLETVQRKKYGIQLTVEKLENASNSLNKLIDSQIVDNCKKGLGYNAAPPSYTGLFMPPKPDLSYIGIEEFTSEPAVETLNAKTSEEVPKLVKKDNGAPIIEDWKLDDKDESVPQPKIEKKTVKPSVAKNAERRNRTLIEAARTMLADSKLPTTFCVEAVSTACYVQNRVFVVKPHNKTPYALFHGRTLMLSFMRPFRCPVTILNTIDHLGKFDGKADKGFFVGYSLNSKAFRLFNSRTRIVRETLHIRFSENTPNSVGSGPNWLFDIDALTKTMNYQPVVACTQSNGNEGTKDNNNAGQARKEKEPGKDYILLPVWIVDPPFLQKPKSSQDAGFRPSNDVVKKVNEVPRQENKCKDQE
nr:ribonuclease H-like domain-containing protein [Tanacetum cinerariifolium]